MPRLIFIDGLGERSVRMVCMECAYFFAEPLSEEEEAMSVEEFVNWGYSGSCKRRHPEVPTLASDYCGDFAAGSSGQSRFTRLHNEEKWDALEAALREDDAS